MLRLSQSGEVMAPTAHPTVRPATLADVPGIVEVYRTDILDGNPWLEADTCAEHLERFQEEGHTALVAERAGRVLGEVEFFVAEEPPYGRLASLNVICTHGQRRRQGVGRALMEQAFEIARRQGAELMHVTPSETAIPFYRRLGFEEDHGFFRVRVGVPGRSEETERRPMDCEPYDIVAGLVHPFGRFISSRHSWFITRDRSGLAEGGDFCRRFRLTVKGHPACVALERLGRSERAYGWIHPDGSARELFARLCVLAGRSGFESVSTFLSSAVYEKLAGRYDMERLGTEVLLSRGL